MNLQASILCFLFMNLTFPQQLFALTETDILGFWVNQAGDGVIEISQEIHIYKGTIIGSTDGKDRSDANNPNPDLRSRSLQYVVVMGEFKYAGDNKWKEGWVYDPNNGKTYSCKMELIDERTLKIRGYIGISLFGRTEIWTRYDPKLHHPDRLSSSNTSTD